MDTKLIPGAAREDGKVFWNYNPKCRGGEHWVSAEQYARWRLNARRRSIKRYHDQKEGETDPARRARHAQAMRDLRARRKAEHKARSFGNHQFKDRTDEFGVRSFIRGMMLADVPPLPDLRPDQIAMLHAEQSSDWWRDKANSNYPHLPPEE